MSENNNKSMAMIVALVLLVALLGAGAYFSLKKSGETTLPPAETAEATTNTPAIEEAPAEATAEAPAAETEPAQPVVVETKKLEIPSEEVADADAPQPDAALSAPTSTPDVEAMMAKRSIGSPTAPIKITEYSSLTCSHCGQFHKVILPELKTKYIDTGKVELTFKEFPLNPPAADASAILRCMPEDKYVGFMNMLFETQDNWAYKPEYKDILRQNAKLAGMSDEQFDACLANDGLKKRILADMQAASQAHKIQSTPSFIVEGRAEPIVGAQPLEFFEKVFTEVGGAAVPPAPAAAQ